MTDGGGITRRGVLAGAMALGAIGPAMAKTKKPVAAPNRAQSLDQLLAAAPAGADHGLVVLDARSGQVIEAWGEARSLPPASVQKTITTLFALDRLGAGGRLVTRVLGTGPVSGGTLQGDLILQGGGDPTLDTDTLGDLVVALTARGVRKVAGRFVVDATALPTFDRIAEDQPEQAGYNPGLSGLQLNFNRVNFEWTRGAANLVMNARGERFLAPVHVATMAAVPRKAPLFTRADAKGVEAWSVAQGALAKDGSRWLPVRHVAPYVADVFAGLAAAQGIRLPAPQMGRAPAGAVVLAERHSDPLAAILQGMLKYSTNITAETMGLMASGAGDLRGSAKAMEAWAQARLGLSADFVDHSGLGSASRVTPGRGARRGSGGRRRPARRQVVVRHGPAGRRLAVRGCGFRLAVVGRRRAVDRAFRERQADAALDRRHRRVPGRDRVGRWTGGRQAGRRLGRGAGQHDDRGVRHGGGVHRDRSRRTALRHDRRGLLDLGALRLGRPGRVDEPGRGPTRATARSAWSSTPRPATGCSPATSSPISSGHPSSSGRRSSRPVPAPRARCRRRTSPR